MALFLWLHINHSSFKTRIFWIHINFFIAVTFLIVPQNATALEGSIHTFECATNNPNFSILWFVDNTNAHYERVRVRGFKSHYINQTFERLTALSSLRNNNLSIDCLAVRPPGKGSFLRKEL